MSELFTTLLRKHKLSFEAKDELTIFYLNKLRSKTEEITKLKTENENANKLSFQWADAAKKLSIENGKLKAENKDLIETVEYAHAQDIQLYGMPESEAVKFRMRKVFSILEECLNRIKEGEQ